MLQVTADSATERCALGSEVERTLPSFSFYGASGTGDGLAVELAHLDETAVRAGLHVDLEAGWPAERVVVGRRLDRLGCRGRGRRQARNAGLDASGWAAGVCAVHAEDGREAATVRLSVVR